MLSTFPEICCPRTTTSIRQPTSCGLGGIGKPRVAFFHVPKQESSFRAIFRIQADESTKMAEGFHPIAH